MKFECSFPYSKEPATRPISQPSTKFLLMSPKLSVPYMFSHQNFVSIYYHYCYYFIELQMGFYEVAVVLQ
jgi:hypothetical protein